jgi:hypothetical protein
MPLTVFDPGRLDASLKPPCRTTVRPTGASVRRELPIVVGPGTASAWETPPPAPMPRRLTISGGFAVIDQQHRLHERVRANGYADLDSYLQARCQQQASPAHIAKELDTPTTAVHRLLAQCDITPPPRQVSAARRRRSSTDEQLVARAAELGFSSLRGYLAARTVERRWQAAASPASLRSIRARCVTARPARAAPPALDRAPPPGDPAADGVLGGQAAGPPGRAGIWRCGGLSAGAAGRAGLVASAHAHRTPGGLRMAEAPDAPAPHPLTTGTAAPIPPRRRTSPSCSSTRNLQVR